MVILVSGCSDVGNPTCAGQGIIDQTLAPSLHLITNFIQYNPQPGQASFRKVAVNKRVSGAEDSVASDRAIFSAKLAGYRSSSVRSRFSLTETVSAFSPRVNPKGAG